MHILRCSICAYLSQCGLRLVLTTHVQANEHHRKHIESLPHNSYPLEPTGNPAEVQESQKVTNEPLGQR